MKLKDLGDIGNVIAAVGVIISLLIVAWQIGENTNAVRAEANLSLATMVSSWASWQRDPDFVDLLVRARQDLDKLTNTERLQYSAYVGEIFNTWEQAFLFQEQGLLDKQQWLAWNRGMFAAADSTAVRAIWEGAQEFYGPEFREHVNMEYAQE